MIEGSFLLYRSFWLPAVVRMERGLVAETIDYLVVEFAAEGGWGFGAGVGDAVELHS